MSNNYIGKIRLVKQPDFKKPNPYIVGCYDAIPTPPKLQQFDGKDWVDVEIVELEVPSYDLR